MGLFTTSETPQQRRDREQVEAELLALAAHEVGHAIGCAAAGIEVREVGLRHDRGYTQHREIDAHNQTQVDGVLVMTLAGWAAGAEWVHRHHGMSRGAALRWSRGGSESDWAEFRRLRRRGSHSSGWYERAAQRLVRSNWSRINRLARDLARTGHLPGKRFT